MDEASAPESSPCECKIQHASLNIPRLFPNGNQRNLPALAKNQNDQKTYLTKIILRSFGCCPHRNLGNFVQETAFEARPSWGALKAFSCGPSEVPDVGRK
jgi:hypothetical protein